MGNSKILFRNCEKIRKIYKMSRKVSKNFENITKYFEENFEKMKSKFWRNFLDKKCIKSNLIRNSPFATKRASPSRLPTASYLSLIYFRVTARAMHEATIFVDASSGRLPIYLHTKMVVNSNCVLSVLVISFSYFNTEIY